MLGLLRNTSQLKAQNFSLCLTRGISLTGTRFVKQIVETQDGKARVFEGIMKPSTREPYMIKKDDGEGACPLCSLNLDVKHTDVLILSQFLKSDGSILPPKITKLCMNQQKRVTKMIEMAQRAGLMSNKGNKPKKRSKWEKFNAYFDESTIRPVGKVKEPEGTIYENSKYKQNTRFVYKTTWIKGIQYKR